MGKKIWRILFSRYAVCAVAIILELLIIASVVAGASVVSYLFISLNLVIYALSLVSIINRDTNPEYKVSWAIVILILPLLGTLLYVIFYRRRMTRKEERQLDSIMNEIGSHQRGGERPEDCGPIIDGIKDCCSLTAGKAIAICNDDRLASVYTGTSSEFFASGEALFKSMLESLRSAKSFIFLEYFIISEGELWGEIHDILVKKAAEGVEVRVMFDDFGCMATLPSNYEHTLRHEGISAMRFSKISPKMSSVHNNRDHRKICIVDGRVGYTGGVNIADEYANLTERFGHWKDGGIKLTGNAVSGLINHFLSGWDYTSGSLSDYDRYYSAVAPAETSDGGYYIPFGSGPVPIYERPVGKNVFLNLINQASSYVYITTPYLVIDYDLTESLRNAALRGVDVRIITPGIADKKSVKVMTKSSYPYLMKAGIKIYEYTPGFIHEKILVCDDKYAVVGTINLDYRSLVHHYENAVWMYSSPTVIVARDEFMKTLERSDIVDEKTARLTVREWLTRNAIRLFSPLL